MKIKSLEQENELLRLKFCTLEQQMNQYHTPELSPTKLSPVIIPTSPIVSSPQLRESDDTLFYDSGQSLSQVFRTIFGGSF